MKQWLASTCAAFLLPLLALNAFAGEDGAALYGEHCASCHGAERLGGTGPALLPSNLGRLRKKKAAKVISHGRTGTQMPGFGDALSDADVDALVAYIYKVPKIAPTWTEQDIAESRTLNEAATNATKPVFDADPLNLFVVVETGDHHATIMDGDTFETVTRFPTRYALHGGPKFTPGGRYVFFMSRDGWVMKYDIWSLEVVGEVRAGINSRNIAISRDGKHLAVANYLPHTLVILSTEDLSVEKVFQVADRKGNSSRVSAVYQAPQRNSFIAALKDVAEIWEISTDPNAEPVFEGLVHSHEKGMVEGLASSSGLFAHRRIEVPEPIDDFFFDPPYRHLIGSARGKAAIVVNLNVGRDIARIELPGLPHLGSGIAWDYEGRKVMATPHLKEGRITVIDLTDWSVIKTIETKGPGFFMRSHENSPYAWTDVFFGANKDVLHVIDKRTLEIVKTLRPAPGKTAAHIEFDRDGSHAIASIWEKDGAIVIYDAKTLEEVKRIPMSKPSGKYNVWNKITFSEGTSH
ncbi:MAG: cytochrome D1 domain-containing protein [Hyphomicrobiales bacterium]